MNRSAPLMQFDIPNVVRDSMEVVVIAVASVKIGSRYRQDMGDIDALAANIAEIGLLHPIVVTPSGELIAGERRIHAFRALERSEIPATVIDLDRVVRGEYAENFF